MIGDVFSCVGRLKSSLGSTPHRAKTLPPTLVIHCKFFALLSACFPANNKLYKIINKNTIKLSYSCMSNIKQSIANHNKAILRAFTEWARRRPVAGRVRLFFTGLTFTHYGVAPFHIHFKPVLRTSPIRAAAVTHP